MKSSELIAAFAEKYTYRNILNELMIQTKINLQIHLKDEKLEIFTETINCHQPITFLRPVESNMKKIVELLLMAIIILLCRINKHSLTS